MRNVLRVSTAILISGLSTAAYSATITVSSEQEFFDTFQSGSVNGGDTIQFSPLFDVFDRTQVNRRFSLDNAGSAPIVIDGQNDLTLTGGFADRNYFDIDSGAFIFRNMVFDKIVTSELFSTSSGGGAHLTLENVTVNNVTSSSSVIQVTTDASLTIRDSQFTNNETVPGTASSFTFDVIGTVGTTEISNTSFSGNDTRTVISSRGQLTLNSVAITNNPTLFEALSISCLNDPGTTFGYSISNTTITGNDGLDARVNPNCIGEVSPNDISNTTIGAVDFPLRSDPGIITASTLNNVTIADETYNPAVIPLPAGIWLLLSALGLLVLRRSA